MQIGDEFMTRNCGPVTVIRYVRTTCVHVVFNNTGHMLITSKQVLQGSERPRLHDPLAPTVFGVGCIGVGRHRAHDGQADTPIYGIWRAMLRRCYYLPEQKPHRVGNRVCKEWLNFQNFAEWYEANHPNDGRKYQLDKDIKVRGNRLYCPERCSLVTQQQNLAARYNTGRSKHRRLAPPPPPS